MRPTQLVRAKNADNGHLVLPAEALADASHPKSCPGSEGDVHDGARGRGQLLGSGEDAVQRHGVCWFVAVVSRQIAKSLQVAFDGVRNHLAQYGLPSSEEQLMELRAHGNAEAQRFADIEIAL